MSFTQHHLGGIDLEHGTPRDAVLPSSTETVTNIDGDFDSPVITATFSSRDGMRVLVLLPTEAGWKAVSNARIKLAPENPKDLRSCQEIVSPTHRQFNFTPSMNETIETWNRIWGRREAGLSPIGVAA